MFSTKPFPAFIGNHIKALTPVLDKLESLGFAAETCLRDTGISLSQIKELETTRKAITLEQEFRLYQNILEITQDPLIGIELGQGAYPDALGMLGYAIMTAPTTRTALHIAVDYHPLTFSFFKLNRVTDSASQLSGVAFQKQYDIPDSLLQLFSDQAIQASLTVLQEFRNRRIDPMRVRLMHQDSKNIQFYENHFRCPIELNCPQNEVLFTDETLDSPLLKSDPVICEKYQEECRNIINNLRSSSAFIHRIREIILENPGHFPSANEVAKSLGCTGRTMRRKLAEEKSSYQDLFNEIRSELAKDYLKSNFSIEDIAELLGYSEASAFSNAFKTWESVSPRQYREIFQTHKDTSFENRKTTNPK